MSQKKQVIIHLLDEVNVKITGLSTEHSKMFQDAYAIFAENYFFNPKYKFGAWDGKIRYFQADGKTYYHLLDGIMKKLVALDYNITLNDLRTSQVVSPPLIDETFFQHLTWPDSGERVDLYDHQVRVVNALVKEGHGLAIAATGAGKTLICGAMCLLYNKLDVRMMVIVPSQDLIQQTYDEFAWLGVDVGEYSGTRKDVDHATVVSTWQALKNNKSILNGFRGVIVDEAHGLTGEILREMLLDHGGNIAHRFGVTGTLPKGKSDAFAVTLAVGNVKETVTAKELIDKGILAKLDIHIEQLEEDMVDKYNEFIANNIFLKKPTYIQFKDTYFPEYSAEKDFLSKNKDRMEWVANRIETVRQQGNTFVLVDGVTYGKKLAELIPNAMFVYGNDKVKVRKKIYSLFKTENNLVVIATVNIASTGINIKRIYNLFLVDIGKSFTRVIQSIGRGLRVAPDKDHVDIYDICSDLKYSKKHVAERIKYYKDAQYPYTKTVKQYNKKDVNNYVNI